MDTDFDTIIVGGGAAGIFAAINIGQKSPSKKILVLEKSQQLLAKVKVSGGGRCNVTHACFNPKELVNYYPRGQKELLGPFYQFQPGDTIAWFADRGIELKTEEDGRMFPISNDSQTIIDCFLGEVKKYNIEIVYQQKVEHVEKLNPGFKISTPSKAYTSKNLVVSTGGFNKLENYKFIADLGHQIIAPTPSLFTFNLPKHPILELQGLVSNAEVKILGSNYIEQGPLLITHWGMSGPAILKLSSWAARFLHEAHYNFNFEVNWTPDCSMEDIMVLLSEHKTKYGSKKVANQLEIDVPKKLKAYLLQKATINEQTKWADLSKKQLHELAIAITKDEYHSIGKTTFKQEFVSCGGVSLKEVNFKTMESKLAPNLYFAGEVLDIDALTGGFNFQAAWTGAWIISESIKD